MFLVLLIANALFLRQLALWTASRTYRPAFSSLHGRPQARKRARAAAVDWLLYAAAGFLPREVRLMMVKDFRLFRRDPVQWSQFLIFLGLLGLYFVNIRTFHYDSQYIGWVNMVSFLNLSVVGLLMSTFTTRFVFPMISLEGQRFWVLGLLPVRRETILWSKFAFAVGGSLIPCSALIFLSDCMLAVAPLILASHQLTCAVLCVGLAGIAVGLGARLPSLREQSPSRVAAGFGGTLNLVVSTLYIVVVVLLTALPCHFYVMALNPLAETAFARESTFSLWIRFWFVAGAIGSVVLGVLATFIPLRMGIRAFRRMEF
jgi:ABC-2 type transport system permease protein